MSRPLVSVYITNHNYGRFIKQSVESVLAQTLQDFEVIIIDDGSTDHSREIIEYYSAHPQTRIVYQQRKGLNITNNIALRLARGRYIMRLDADDYLDPNALLVMSRVLENDKKLGLVFPDYYLVDVHGNVLNMERRHTFSKDVSLLDMPAHGACTLIRRQFLLDVGGYDESFSCQDGYDLWIKFTNHYKVTNVNLPLFYYRQHGGNLTRNEKRILNTRSAIKRRHSISKGHQINAIAVIPIRGASVDPSSVALLKLGRKKVVDWAVESALLAETVDAVVIVTSDPAVKKYVATRYSDVDKVVLVERPEELARVNKDIRETLGLVLADARIRGIKPSAVAILSVEAPFMSPRFIEDAVRTLDIFKVDTVVSVRPETSIMYQHDGRGLHVILNQDKFTRLEREALFKHVGGLTAYRVSCLRKKVGQEVRAGHVVVDQESAHMIRSEHEMNVARYLARNRT